MSKAKQSKEPNWITLKEGNRRVYILTHPNPAYHERFLIEKGYIKGFKTPHYIIYDKLKRVRGAYTLLRDAKVHVNKCMIEEVGAAKEGREDIRISVYNLWKNDRHLEALMQIIHHIEKQNESLREDLEDDIQEIKYGLRNL